VLHASGIYKNLLPVPSKTTISLSTAHAMKAQVNSTSARATIVWPETVLSGDYHRHWILNPTFLRPIRCRSGKEDRGQPPEDFGVYPPVLTKPSKKAHHSL
jgi:hypothetical protein